MSIKKSLALVALLAFTVSLAFSFQITQEKRVIVKRSNDAKSAWLGVQLQSVKTSVSSNNETETTTGEVTVAGVEKGSPAEKAGIKKGDILLELDGKKIDDTEALVESIIKAKQGDKVNLLLLSDNEKKSITVELGERPKSERRINTGKNRRGNFFNMPRAGNFNFDFGRNQSFFGATLMKLNTELGEYFKSPTKKGMLITKVRGESAGAKAGLKVGDVIVSIGKESVEDMHDITTAVSDYKQGDKMEVSVIRKEKNVTVSIEVSDKDIKRFSGRNMFFFDGNRGRNFDVQKFKLDLDTINSLKFGKFFFNKDSLKCFYMDSLSFDLDSLRAKLKDLPDNMRGKFRNFAPYRGNMNFAPMFEKFGKGRNTSIYYFNSGGDSLKTDMFKARRQHGETKAKHKRVRVKDDRTEEKQNIMIKIQKSSDEEFEIEDDEEIIIIETE